MRKSLVGLSVGIGAALISAMLDAPAVSSADPGGVHLAREGSCADIQVVFARGTGEPPGPGLVGQAFVDSLRSRVNGKSVVVYAIDYPASYDFLRAVDGANDARQFVESTAASCPRLVCNSAKLKTASSNVSLSSLRTNGVSASGLLSHGRSVGRAQREFGAHGGARAGGGLQPEPAAERLHPVLEADQAGSAR